MTSPSTASPFARRICVVAPEFIGPFPNGGVGTACYWEAFTLGRAGYDVTVLYTGPTQAETPGHWEAHFAAGAPFRYVDLFNWVARHGAAAGVDDMRLPCPEARTAELVLAFLRTVDVDLVMFQEFLGHGARALQARAAGEALRGVRATTTLHSCRQWIYEGMHRLPSSPADMAVDFLERESARLADRMVAPSRHMADWASRRWHLEGATIIPYCYDELLASPATAIEHAGPFTHLVFFGRLETRKGVQVFCRALAADPRLQQQVSTVTFLGKPSSVDGLSSEEFIAAAMAEVPGIAWTIKGILGSFEALAWLSAQPNVLVVTPSLVDNLPYTMIELHSRRIPFVATRIGGIPEVVGEANGHVLADATPGDLARVLARVTAERRLAIDYRSGYDIGAANALHVQFVAEVLAEPAPAVQSAHGVPFSVVVTHASADDVSRLRERVIAVDAAAAAGRWERFEDWRSSPESLRAVFVDARVEPMTGLVTRLLDAVAQPGVDVATSYYMRRNAGQEAIEAPLGGALEIGWSRNCFGGPCFAVDAAAAARLAQSRAHGPFALWPAYAAMACAGLSFTVIPEPLYHLDGDAADAPSHDEVEAVIGYYHAAAPGRLDLGWVLKGAIGAALSGAAAPRTGDSLGRGLYERFVSTPDDLLMAFAGLDTAAGADPYVRQLSGLRERLQALAARWRSEDPQVFISGAGQHAKLLLSLCPEIGSFLAGFIDRRPMKQFLGRRCITPEAFRDEMADVILYSSREYEAEMYATLQHARVEHVLLYRDSPAAGAATTAVRLQRRFGHAAADLAATRAMYKPPAWATGYISGSDADFLAGIVAAQQPTTVVELGVASGASSAVLLHALDQLPDPEQRLLISCDVTAACYFNADYATGQAVREMYPRFRAQWRLQTDTDARRLAQQRPPASVDLTFIDANHLHPWPLLDLLHLAAAARPASWVVLHDVELPVQHPEFQVFGPRWLFAAWPFAKVKGIGRWTSIGAVQLPRTLSELVPVALTLLERPWESSLPATEARLPAAFDAVAAALRARCAADGRSAAQAALSRQHLLTESASAASLLSMRDLFPAPAWVQGAISVDEAEFIAALVGEVQPRSIVEIGVAAGVSSAALLLALDRLPAAAGDRVLYSCDVTWRCYFDEERHTGEAAREMYPTPRAHWVLDTDSDARRLAGQLAMHSVDLTFIDGNHRHPWPLLDVLHMARLAKPRSWVVLHDVALAQTHPAVQVYGAQWLFDAWPFERLLGTGRAGNIGAVRLPGHPHDLMPMALSLLDRPWEDVPTPWHIGLGPSLAVVEARMLERVAQLTNPPADASSTCG